MGKKKQKEVTSESFEQLSEDKKESLKMILNKDLVVNLMTKEGTHLKKQFKKGDTLVSGKDIEESTFIRIKEHHSEE